MEQGLLVTAFAIMAALAVVIKGLRTRWYLLHIGITAALCYALESKKGVMALFSADALFWALVMHLISINLVIIVVYGWDKHAARSGGWRVPERVLHGFAIAGATPGAYIAQQTFRHKNKKKDFRILFWMIFFFQCVALFVLSGQV